MPLTPFERQLLKMQLSKSRTRNSLRRWLKNNGLLALFFSTRPTTGETNVPLTPPPMQSSLESVVVSKVILLSLLGLLVLCLLLSSSGCANAPPTPTVIHLCQGTDQFLTPTKEPLANNQTEGQKDETHANLQGALASCNTDKKSARDTLREINSKGDSK